MRTQVNKVQIINNQLIIDCEDMNKEYLAMIKDNKQLAIEVDILDNRLISNEQRKLIYALLRDISLFTGFEIDELKDYIRNYLELVRNANKLSLANCSKEQAKEYIHLLIDLIMKFNIPLKKRYEYLTQDNYFFYKCLKHKKCCVCGKDNADIAHFETVGMGRDRKNINHENFRFMSLCREHHTEQHKIGINTFIDKYKILPIKLNREELNKILSYGKQG